MPHTPGPWQQVANEIIGGHGDLIADVTGGEGNRFVDEEDNIECLANAQLIAVAPDLLAVLERFADYCKQHSVPELQGIACDAFQAINKAKGIK
jgi:hypothetical protein